MVNLLGDLISALSDTVGAWNKFRRSDTQYFSYDGKPPTSPLLNQSVAAVRRTFSDLEDLLQKLKDLEKTLCKGVSQLSPSFEYEDELHHTVNIKLIGLSKQLNSHLNIENNEAAFFQQRTGRHIQVLTVLTIVSLSLSIS